ncbi:MAG: flavodoxin, partial [Oscillospiraceae bacterium]|nr:flavodoxin [Oscillospiraceae bacterium]
AEPYSDADLDWNDRNSRTTIEMNDPNVRPEIANDTVDLEGYTTVYIGYPIWWGDAPRIMSTFVESHDLEGKTVIPFCTSGGSSIGRSGENLAAQAGSGNWLAGDRLDADITESEILDRINTD